jgi:hypothetical protein
MKAKESAFGDYIAMIKKSWTYEKMSDSEQAMCMEAFCFANEQGILRGNFNARFSILHAVYHAYLLGLGYAGGGSWRDDEDTPF